MLLGISRGIDAATERLGWLADWMVLLSCLVSASNAASRYLFSYSSNAYLEIQWHMFGTMVLLGASHTLRMNEHVRVDVVYGALSERTRLAVDAFGFAFFLLPVTVFLTWLSWPFFWRSFELGEMSTNAGGLILWPIKVVLPIGFALLSLQGVSELIKRIAALQGHVTFTTKYEKPLQ